MRKFVCAYLVLAWCAALAFALSPEELTWSMALLNDGGGVSFSRPVAMKHGECFSLVIKPKQACYAYVTHLNAKGQTAVLANKRLAANETWWWDSAPLSLPAGREVIHVIMSVTEQPDIEKAMSAFRAQNGADTAPALNTAVAMARRSASRFKGNPEAPVGMGGAIRGSAGVLTGTEYSGAGLYVKTIVITH